MKLFIFIFTISFSLSIKADNNCLKTELTKRNVNDSLFLEQSTGVPLDLFSERLQVLDASSPMDLLYNDKVKPFIESYLTKNKSLIGRMKGLSPYYFSIFEQALDKHNLPLELKYLAIVESALNPKAKSSSGATGLWQFMYLTGKEYGLNVNSYIDDRQDPIKSTEAACTYFIKLYEMFGDWNLVLAAYNGGPGYIQRKIASTGKKSFWELEEHLRRETRNYIPTFIAVNYAMNYAEEHNIETIFSNIKYKKPDTIVLKKQTDLKALKELTCLNKETINYLNPSYKKEIYPKGAIIILPSDNVEDFLLNEESNYSFIEMIEKKEILIDEERIVYRVKKGDYLGKIAKEYSVRVFEIKEWNNLKTTSLDIGEKLVLFVPIREGLDLNNQPDLKNEYVVQKGDTLWGIAKKFDGVSVSKIKALNNLEGDNLKPGTKIILPTT